MVKLYLMYYYIVDMFVEFLMSIKTRDTLRDY